MKHFWKNFKRDEPQKSENIDQLVQDAVKSLEVANKLVQDADHVSSMMRHRLKKNHFIEGLQMTFDQHYKEQN